MNSEKATYRLRLSVRVLGKAQRVIEVRRWMVVQQIGHIAGSKPCRNLGGHSVDWTGKTEVESIN